jgi:hypothetical protein
LSSQRRLGSLHMQAEMSKGLSSFSSRFCSGTLQRDFLFIPLISWSTLYQSILLYNIPYREAAAGLLPARSQSHPLLSF